MAIEYRKFKLNIGQTSPNGSTFQPLEGDWIVWRGEAGTFPSGYTNAVMTQQEIDRFEASQRSHMTKLQFNQRFTLGELTAIEVAAETNPTLRVLQKQQAMAQYIDLLDPSTIAGVEYLVAQGLLTPERANEILTA